jgi:hypothetical protein
MEVMAKLGGPLSSLDVNLRKIKKHNLGANILIFLYLERIKKNG